MRFRSFRWRWLRSALALAGVFVLADLTASAAEQPLRDSVEPFLRRYCFACHAGEAPEGGLNLETHSHDLGDGEVRRRWVDLYDRVDGGEMPPATEKSPDAQEKGRFLTLLAAELSRAAAAGRAVTLRRINREEYVHTVSDMFGIFVDLRSTLPDDAVEQGFDTIGSSLSLSPEQMVLYLEAADLVLDEVFGPAQAPPRVQRTLNFRELRSLETADRVDPDGVVLFSGAKSLPMYGFDVRGPASYRVTIEAKAIQAERPVIMQVEGGVTGRIPGHSAGFFEVPPDKPTTIEVIDRAVETHDTFAFRLVGGFPWWSVKADEYRGVGLWLGNITVEGPLEEWPRPSRTRLLGNIDPQAGTLDDVRSVLQQLLPRAFRRPTPAEAAAPFVGLAEQALAEGEPFEKALRRALKGVLCSPEFLFLEEPQLAENDNAAPRLIDDYSLAARISYFLWSSLPDEELTEQAARGELHQPEILEKQIERLLNDPRADRFVTRFTNQWLRLRDIDFTHPNEQLYPEYDQLLRQSMLEETRAFFREILDRNHSVQSFIDSDFAMLNRPLAEFYGIPGVGGLKMQRVELPAESRRGGVLTQASVLKVSADGTRTSPVLRGAWILKYLYGQPSPPPPPAVAAIEPDIRGATTIREQLQKHRQHAHCNRCHRKIDPPGFALEGFDVIGGERPWYRLAQGGTQVSKPLHPEAPMHHVRYQRGADVDMSGQMPDGRPFADIQDYKRLLLEDETAMANALTRLLLSYALGRHLDFADRPEIERIVAAVQPDDYGLRSIIRQVVLSPAFRQP